MSSTSQKVDFTLVRVILRGPPTVFNTIFILNKNSGPGNLSAFQDLKLTNMPSLDKICTLINGVKSAIQDTILKPLTYSAEQTNILKFNFTMEMPLPFESSCCCSTLGWPNTYSNSTQSKKIKMI